MAPTENEYITISEAARALGLPDSTLRSWADRGKIPSYQRRGTNRRYVKLAEVRTFAEFIPGEPPPRYQG